MDQAFSPGSAASTHTAVQPAGPVARPPRACGGCPVLALTVVPFPSVARCRGALACEWGHVAPPPSTRRVTLELVFSPPVATGPAPAAATPAPAISPSGTLLPRGPAKQPTACALPPVSTTYRALPSVPIRLALPPVTPCVQELSGAGQTRTERRVLPQPLPPPSRAPQLPSFTGPPSMSSLTGLGLDSEAPPRVTAVLPAHNEEATLARTIDSLRAQTRPVDRLLVVSDNSTDATVQVAAEMGVEVFETVGNTARKAGALNQALHQRFRRRGDRRTRQQPVLVDRRRGDRRHTGSPASDRVTGVLCVDADGVLAPGFLSRALAELQARPEVGAVGAVVSGRPGGRFVEQLQRLEFARAARMVARRKGSASILSGTATLHRPQALAAVHQARTDGSLPGQPGPCEVYAAHSITEDHELTLALKHLGWRCVSPKGCQLATDLMPTWRQLWQQRVRWYRGAIEDIMAYGPTRVAAPYLLRQARVALDIMVLLAFVAALGLTVAVSDGLAMDWRWLAILAVLIPERIVSARRAGRSGMALAGIVVVEVVYTWFQLVIYVVSWWQALRGSKAAWGKT